MCEHDSHEKMVWVSGKRSEHPLVEVYCNCPNGVCPQEMKQTVEEAKVYGGNRLPTHWSQQNQTGV